MLRLLHAALHLAALVSLLLFSVPSAPAQGSPHIRIDHFGWRPLASKVAILREPVIGFDAPAPYIPGAVIEVRRASNNSVAFSAAAVPWNGGAVHAQSGDRIWEFDFSTLTEVGEFYIIDPSSQDRSENFRIANDVYDQVFSTAMRMFYYQRCGTAKATPFADPRWADSPCHVGAEQDSDCRSVLNPVPASSRDLSGGWHDAGDFNKYINFADDAVHPLLYAFETAPWRFRDDHGIPESGNGRADILDEVKWELDWMLRMQNTDGSVLHKISVSGFQAASPPSADSATRRYGPATASATVSACGAYAHGAHAMRRAGDANSLAYAQVLETAAIAAWNWLDLNPLAFPSTYNNFGFSSVPAEDDSYWQQANRVRAAIWLFAITGQSTYRNYVDQNWQLIHLYTWTWAGPWEQDLAEALLAYSRLPLATASTALQIRSTMAAAAQNQLPLVTSNADPYRAPLNTNDYTWGSNRTKSLMGSVYASVNEYGVDVVNARQWLDAAEGFVHGFHGLNPMGLSYLTHMDGLGSEHSCRETYHGWFDHNSVFDNADTGIGPAPGFLVGGPNPTYTPDAAYTGPVLSPPMGQPAQKSFLDWNTSWPENSWAVTECHIPYQAAYVRLLAWFASQVPPRLSMDVSPVSIGQPFSIQVGGVSPQKTAALVFALNRGRWELNSPLWCADLGLTLDFPNLLSHILILSPPSAQGTLDLTLTLPPAFSGLSFSLQATEAETCPSAVQSQIVDVIVP